MLISDSMPLLWLCYMALSLVVLATGYMAIRWLPILPRLVVTGLVAGILWMPAGFTLSMPEGEAPYQGLAPAIMVTAVAFLQQDSEAFPGALSLLVLGSGLGVAAGVLLWAGLRRRSGSVDKDNDNATGAGKPAPARREPVIG